MKPIKEDKFFEALDKAYKSITESKKFIIEMQKNYWNDVPLINDGANRKGNNNNICLAFTVDDVDLEFERLKSLGIEIIDPPTERPWDAKK